MRSASFETWQLVTVVPPNCSACTGFPKPKHPFVSRIRATIPGRPLEFRIMEPQYVLPEGASLVSSRFDSGTFYGVPLHLERFTQIPMSHCRPLSRVLIPSGAFYVHLESCTGAFRCVSIHNVPSCASAHRSMNLRVLVWTNLVHSMIKSTVALNRFRTFWAFQCLWTPIGV